MVVGEIMVPKIYSHIVRFFLHRKIKRKFITVFSYSIKVETFIIYFIIYFKNDSPLQRIK